MEKHYGGVSHKFVNFALAVIFVLGLLEWYAVTDTLRYVLFLFTYALLIRYWQAHGAHLERFPPKDATGVMIDITAVFSLFLLIRAALLPFGFYFAVLAVLLAVDSLRLCRAISEYKVTDKEKAGIRDRRLVYFVEASIYVVFESLLFYFGLPGVLGITALFLVWVMGRVSESLIDAG